VLTPITRLVTVKENRCHRLLLVAPVCSISISGVEPLRCRQRHRIDRGREINKAILSDKESNPWKSVVASCLWLYPGIPEAFLPTKVNSQ